MRAEIRATPRLTAVVVVWPRKETRWVRCTARRTQASEPTLTAFAWFGGEETRRAECATKVNLSCYFTPGTSVCRNVTDCCSCFCCSLPGYEFVPTERCAPSAHLLVSRPEPAPANCCSLATERRTARRLGREATSLYSCVAIQLINCSAAARCRG